MLAKLLIASLMCSLALTGGCAASVASKDANAAMLVAADANMTNIRTLVRGRMSERQAALTELDAEMPKVLARVKDGAAAVKAWTFYQTNKLRLEKLRDAEGARLQGALNTASVLQVTAGRRINLNSAWDAWLGRFPALSTLKTMAEAEVRTYMHDLRTGVKINDGSTP